MLFFCNLHLSIENIRDQFVNVKAALQDGRWMKGLHTPALIDQFVKLWASLQTVQLSSLEDSVTWKQSKDGTYSAASAYEACFFGRIPRPLLAATWEVKSEGKICFFLWLLIQNRLWTADRLQARGWPHQDNCAFCDQQLENANHLFLESTYAKHCL